MKLMIGMLKLLPAWLKRRIPAPMLEISRLRVGGKYSTIAMNLANLLICAEYCGREEQERIFVVLDRR